MSVENPRNSYPPLQETVKPIDRVLIASANIIDMLATVIHLCLMPVGATTN
ncbi:MAG: hypothetical protein V4678_04025 [Patescibacteria group bacterium]